MANALQIVQQLFPDVIKVSDAKKAVNVEVSRRDINSSTVRSHKACAMAVACKRKFKADGVIISVNRAYLIKGNKATRFVVSPSIAREVVAFDRGGAFEVGEYKLNAVPKRERLGVRQHGSPNGSQGPSNGGMKKRFVHRTEGIRASLGSKEI